MGACAFLFLFAGDANAIPGLDAGYFSGQSIGLLIAPVLKFEAVRAGDSAAIKRVVMVNGVIDPEPNSRADSGYGNPDPDRVASVTLDAPDWVSPSRLWPEARRKPRPWQGSCDVLLS